MWNVHSDGDVRCEDEDGDKVVGDWDVCIWWRLGMDSEFAGMDVGGDECTSTCSSLINTK